ncbi:MAG: hypothetical protein AB7O68_25825 [Pirellulales bacterium]
MRSTVIGLVAMMVFAGAPQRPAIIANREVRAILIELNADDPQQRGRAFHSITSKSEQLADGVAVILDSETTDEAADRRILAAKWLALNAPRQGIPVMIRHVEFSPPSQVIDGLNALSGYPCAEALVTAGLDSVAGIFRFLAGSNEVSNKSIELYALIINNLYRKHFDQGHGTDAIELLRRTKIRFPGTKNLERLEAALKALPR